MDQDFPVLRLLNRRPRGRLGGAGRARTVLETLIVQMGLRALAGDAAAARELIRQARSESRDEAEARAWEEENAPLPPLSFNGGRLPSPVERVLFTLGAATEGETETMGNGDPYTHSAILERWVVDAAYARDPTLPGRLKEWELENVEKALRGWRAVGEV